jgi:A/G-specific adenine glycosylase
VVYRIVDPFVGSSRYYRGRVVDHLRKLRPQASLDLNNLGSALRADFGPAHRGWLRQLLNGLAADGLVQLLPREADESSAEDLRVRLA